MAASVLFLQSNKNSDCVYMKHLGIIKNKLLVFVMTAYYVSICTIKFLILLGTL